MRHAGKRPPQGLSPRVRGKPAKQMQTITDCGSIPACAGETGCSVCVAAG